MRKVPLISGREMVRVLNKIGFVIVGHKGSHVRLKRRRDGEIRERNAEIYSETGEPHRPGFDATPVDSNDTCSAMP